MTYDRRTDPVDPLDPADPVDPVDNETRVVERQTYVERERPVADPYPAAQPAGSQRRTRRALRGPSRAA